MNTTIQGIRIALKGLFAQLYAQVNTQTVQGDKLKNTTLANLGKDLSPTQNELGCVETVYTLFSLAFNDPHSPILGTGAMLQDLLSRTDFIEVRSPLPGDIILSVTGTGNGRLSNGHVGVVVDNLNICSNNSYNSLLEMNYNIASWSARYQILGGFPTRYFRRIL